MLNERSRSTRTKLENLQYHAPDAPKRPPLYRYRNSWHLGVARHRPRRRSGIHSASTNKMQYSSCYFAHLWTVPYDLRLTSLRAQSPTSPSSLATRLYTSLSATPSWAEYRCSRVSRLSPARKRYSKRLFIKTELPTLFSCSKSATKMPAVVFEEFGRQDILNKIRDTVSSLSRSDHATLVGIR